MNNFHYHYQTVVKNAYVVAFAVHIGIMKATTARTAEREWTVKRMTNEEAIKIITGVMNNYHVDTMTNRRTDEALSAAIQALKAEPVKHAYVIVDEDGNMECSNCGSSNCFDNYCGTCGAKLIGERKDEVEDEVD